MGRKTSTPALKLSSGLRSRRRKQLASKTSKREKHHPSKTQLGVGGHVPGVRIGPSGKYSGRGRKGVAIETGWKISHVDRSRGYPERSGKRGARKIGQGRKVAFSEKGSGLAEEKKEKGKIPGAAVLQ